MVHGRRAKGRPFFLILLDVMAWLYPAMSNTRHEILGSSPRMTRIA
jgi:hypothetical protein